METNPTCPKCSSAMEEGFVLDRGESYYVPQWQPGQPENTRILGMSTGIPKVNKDQWRPIATYRCTHCGYLESYAP